MVRTGTPSSEPDTERLSLVRHRRFTLAEYHKMIDVGILGEDEHVELLEGEIVQMSAFEKPHARAMGKLTRWFVRALGDEYMVRPQLPLTLTDSEPEPDLAVVRTREEDAAGRHPSSALLVIEISDSSVRHDLKVKARIYAKAGIPEYWVVDVQQRRIVVFRDPETAAGAYRTESTVLGDSSVTPIALPGPVVHVADLFG